MDRPPNKKAKPWASPNMSDKTNMSDKKAPPACHGAGRGRVFSAHLHHAPRFQGGWPEEVRAPSGELLPAPAVFHGPGGLPRGQLQARHRRLLARAAARAMSAAATTAKASSTCRLGPSAAARGGGGATPAAPPSPTPARAEATRSAARNAAAHWEATPPRCAPRAPTAPVTRAAACALARTRCASRSAMPAIAARQQYAQQQQQQTPSQHPPQSQFGQQRRTTAWRSAATDTSARDDAHRSPHAYEVL